MGKLLGCLAVIVIGIVLLITGGCADSKTFTIKNSETEITEIKAEPYGWANSDSKRIDGVIYEVNGGNIVWSIILCETIFVPIYLTGWQLYEPVRLDNRAKAISN